MLLFVSSGRQVIDILRTNKLFDGLMYECVDNFQQQIYFYLITDYIFPQKGYENGGFEIGI